MVATIERIGVMAFHDAEGGRILRHLRFLKHHTRGDRNNFLIVECGDAYVQVALVEGDSYALCEAVSNAHLPETRWLDTGQISALQGAGFEDPDLLVLPEHARTEETAGAIRRGRDPMSPNFFCYTHCRDDDDLRRLAQSLLCIMRAIYYCPPMIPFSYTLVAGGDSVRLDG